MRPLLCLPIFLASPAGPACTGGSTDTGTPALEPEPLDLPEDPAAAGVPVGVRTVEISGGPVVEVWYPAPDAVAGEAGEAVDVGQWVPDSVVERVGAVELGELDSSAVRDAALREPEAPYAVVLFSHGLGAFRSQSPDLVTHLASRGYVVVSADHEGRLLGDLLPCVFSPPLEGCDMSLDDPGEDDIPDVLDWLEEVSATGSGSFLEGRVDLGRVALSGHSAGGRTTSTVGNSDTRVAAQLALASGVPLTGPGPRLLVGGTCDAYADDEAMTTALDESEGAVLLSLLGAGHLPFSDICELDLAGLAEEVLGPRDDVNQAVLDQLVALATDGCPVAEPPGWEDCETEWQDLDQSQEIVRHAATVFLDEALRDGSLEVRALALAGTRLTEG